MAEFEEDMKHLLLYYFRKGKNAWQAYKKLYAEYGIDAFSEKKCIFWFIRFRSGDFSLEHGGPRIHRSIEADNATIKGFIDSDPHITTRDIAEKMDVSQRCVKKKLKKMGYVKLLDVWTLRENLNSKEDRPFRIRKEIAFLMNHPPEGIFCFRKEGTDDGIIVTIVGPPGCSYEADVLELDLDLPPRFPFIHHMYNFARQFMIINIDNNGRICLDLLKMPPTGAWKPTLKLADILVAIKLLLIHPNVDDPLMPEIAHEYINNRLSFEIKARRLHDGKRKRSQTPSIY